MARYAIAIHGGAGTILRSEMDAGRELLYRNALKTAIKAGESLLKSGATAIDAVEAAVRSLEDEPLFNAGRGSVFTRTGLHEMDACIMYGHDRSCGAVAGVMNVKNPISLARTVMEKSEQVMFCGPGAEAFAKKVNAEFRDNAYFYTEERYRQLQHALENNRVSLDHDPEPDKFGTVGAVALDTYGHLAAATSTGGMTNKPAGRVGDTPLPGAGTYASDHSCAVSCTGHGEYFIRALAAYDVSCLMEYKGLSLKEACNEVINKKLLKMGGSGGLIAVDSKGDIELVFNTEGMYRASVSAGEEIVTGIYKRD